METYKSCCVQTHCVNDNLYMLWRQCLGIGYYSSILPTQNANSLHTKSFCFNVGGYDLQFMKSFDIFPTPFSPVLGQNMARLSCKMHSTAAHLFMQLWGRSNSCFLTVSRAHTHSWLCEIYYQTLSLMYPAWLLSAALIEPLPSREAIEEYLSVYVNPTLLRGLTEVCKNKPDNPCVSIQCWIHGSVQVDRYSLAGYPLPVNVLCHITLLELNCAWKILTQIYFL